jgi:hypothetical protein
MGIISMMRKWTIMAVGLQPAHLTGLWGFTMWKMEHKHWLSIWEDTKDWYVNFKWSVNIIQQSVIRMTMNSFIRFGKLLGLIPSLGIFQHRVLMITKLLSGKRWMDNGSSFMNTLTGSFHPNSNFFVAEKNRNVWFFYSVFLIHQSCTV